METDDEYEGTDFSASEDAWNAEEVNNVRTEQSKAPRYLDLKNSRVQNVGQKILDSALASAKKNSESIDSLWRIFIEHIEAYAFAEEVARQIEIFKDDLKDAIKDNCYPELEKTWHSPKSVDKYDVKTEMENCKCNERNMPLSSKTRQSNKSSIKATRLSM